MDGLIDALVLERDTLVELLDEALDTIDKLRSANNELHRALLSAYTSSHGKLPA